MSRLSYCQRESGLLDKLLKNANTFHSKGIRFSSGSCMLLLIGMLITVGSVFL